jgi:hypothetical protein
LIDASKFEQRSSSKLQRHNLQSSRPCALCAQLPEMTQHLIVGCVYSREVRFIQMQKSGRQQLVPEADNPLVDWWLACLKRIVKANRRGFDTFVLLVA